MSLFQFISEKEYLVGELQIENRLMVHLELVQTMVLRFGNFCKLEDTCVEKIPRKQHTPTQVSASFKFHNIPHPKE